MRIARATRLGSMQIGQVRRRRLKKIDPSARSGKTVARAEIHGSAGEFRDLGHGVAENLQHAP